MYEHEFDLKTRKCINTEHTLLYHDHFLWTLPMTTTPITEFRINRGLKQTASVNITILMAFVTSTGTKHRSQRTNDWKRLDKMNGVIKKIPNIMSIIINTQMCHLTLKKSSRLPLLLVVVKLLPLFFTHQRGSNGSEKRGMLAPLPFLAEKRCTFMRNCLFY